MEKLKQVYQLHRDGILIWEITPCKRHFHPPGFLSFEKTIIFAIQGAHKGLNEMAGEVVNQTFVLLKSSIK